MNRSAATRVVRLGGHTPPTLWGISVAAVLGTLLILFREINYGVNLDGDGIGYLIRAQRIQAGPGWLVHLSGDQPPFYPFLLALVGLPGFDLQQVAGVVNATVLGLTILLVGLYLSTRLQSRLLVVWAAFAIMLSIPLTFLAAQASTEPVMVLFSLLSLIHVEKFLDRSTYSSLIWAAVCSALSGLTRYMGIFVALVVVLLLLFRGGVPISKKIRQVAIYSFISFTPICLFLLRNYLLSGLLFWHLPEDWPPYTPLIENLRSWLIALASWGFPISSIWNPRTSIQGAVGLAFPALASLITAGFLFLRSDSRSDARSESNPSSMVTFICFSLGHVALLVITTFLRHLEPENASRYLCPVYVPLVIIVSFVADRLLKDSVITKNGVHPAARKNWKEKSVGVVLISSLFLWLCYPIVENARAAAVHINQGFGYTPAKWRNSDVMRYLADHPVDDPVYSPERFWLEFVGLRTINFWTLDGLMSELKPPLHIVHFNAWFHVRQRRMEKIGPLRDRVDFHLQSGRLPGVESVFSGTDGSVHRFSLRGRSDLGAIIRETKPIIRSDYYNVYLDGNQLIYVRSTAVPHGVAPPNLRFFLHIVPFETKHLYWTQKWLGRRQIDWSEDCSWRSGGRCAVVVGLPAYEIRSIGTGQYLAGANKTYGDLTWWRTIAVVWDFITTGRVALEDHIWDGEFSFVHE